MLYALPVQQNPHDTRPISRQIDRMEQTPEHARRLESLVRTGTVAEVDDGGRVRVQTGGNLTDWISWPVLGGGSFSLWFPPRVGVPVTLLSESGDLGTARILFGPPTDDAPPPSTSATECVAEFEGGARMVFNLTTGKLTLTGIEIESDADVKALGKSLGTHTHGGVQSGGGSTGAPQ